MFQSHFSDVAKVAGVNTTAIVVSLSGLETAIRIAGLVAALVYTCLKIADWVRDRREHDAQREATKLDKSLLLIWAACICFSLSPGCASTRHRPSTVAVAQSIQSASVNAVRAQASARRAEVAIQTAAEAVTVLEASAAPGQRPAVAEVRQSLKTARQQVTEAGAQLVAITKALTDSDARLSAVQKQADKLATALVSAEAKVAAYHRLKFWLMLAAAGMAFYLALQLVPPLVPYRWGIVAGAGAAAGVTVWGIL